MVPHFLTVAGAAQVFHLLPVSPLPKKIGLGTSNRGRIVAKPFLDPGHNLKHTFNMNNDLDLLEQKVDQVLALCGHLHEENAVLRTQVVALEAEKQALTEKMELARTRLAGLVDKLPEGE
jgi:cell division protein ZapB